MADIRFGSGPNGPPRQVVPPPSTRSPGLFLVVTAAVVLIAAAVATGAYLTGRTDARAQVPAPIAESSAVVQLTEDAVCRVLWPDLMEAQRQVTALAEHRDMSTVEIAKIEATIVGIEALIAGAPQDMRKDMTSQVDVLKQIRDVLATGNNRVIDMEAFRASGIRLGSLCLKYAG